MSIHAWMLTGLLMGAPPAPGEVAPTPKLEKDLEIIWRGTFSEAILRPNVRAFRTYVTETRAFVLDTFEGGADIALFTSIKLQPELKALPDPPPIVRLELARVDASGRLWSLPADALLLPVNKRKPLPLPLLPMEGLPTLETALFLGFPAETMRLGQRWNVPEEKRPSMQYKLEGFDSVRGSRCFKVVANQQTDDWDKPRSGTADWRRGETLSISAKHGYVARLERVIEKRDPQSGELGFRSKLVYEHINGLRYPDRFAADRREEVSQAAQFYAQFDRLLPDAGRNGQKPFDDLLRQIDQHVTNNFGGESTPYREVVLYVKRKAEAAKRGHLPPAPLPPETGQTSVLTTGKPAPDLTIPDLVEGETISLSKQRGRAIVLVWYQPESARTAEPVLRFAESLLSRSNGRAAVVPIAIGDGETAVQQRNVWKLSIHVFGGRTAHRIHGIESTPCFVIVDATGVVRNVTLGWSEENAEAVRDEWDKWSR